jgi:hypothetical protein
MSRVVVGRILWKVVRAQRGSWLGALGLSVGIQVLLVVLAISGQPHLLDFQQSALGIFMAAYGAVAAYAIASGAATFTEEHEGRTAVLLRAIPLTPADAFAGKWTYGLASTGLLLLVLSVAGTTCTAITWSTRDPTRDFLISFAPLRAREIAASVWIGLVILIVAFGFSALFSLLFSDGLMAAIGGLFSTICAVVAAWILHQGGSRSSFAQWISAIALMTAVADYGLTRLWLRRGSLVPERSRPTITRRWQRGWKWPTKRRFYFVEALRLAEPVAPWRRAAQRLIWKECAQAWPYANIILCLAVLTTASSVIWPSDPVTGLPWFVALAAPLVMGVGAYHAEQKDRGYTLLGHHGVSADGAWFIKHAVWIVLAVASCACLLLVYEIGWQLRPHFGLIFSRDVAETLYRLVYRQSPNPRVLRDSLIYEAAPIATLYLALGYSIGQRLSFSYSKGTMSFGLAAGLMLAACLAWSIFWERGIPVVWSIGLIPPVLLIDTWAHTESWQTQRMSLRRWYDIAFWTALPFVGIVVAIILYCPLSIR